MNGKNLFSLKLMDLIPKCCLVLMVKTRKNKDREGIITTNCSCSAFSYFHSSTI